VILKEENGTAVYSDGNETERRMLEIARQYPGDLAQDYIANCSEYTVNNTFSSVRENILNWYPFKKGCTILEIGAGMGAITGLLCDKAKAVTAVEMNSVRAEIIKTRYVERKNLNVIVQNIEKLDKTLKFDYVIMVGVLEYSEVFFDVKNPFKYMLELAKSHLNKDGIILCAIENRFGLKYWCGAAEDHLQEPFIGINGYGQDKSPKTLSKYALSQLFDSAGFSNKRFYYVLPDYKFPKAIYTDDYLPIPQDVDNIPFTYSKGSMLYTKEQALYSEIIKNHTFDFFANSYLIEASVKKINNYKINFVSARGEARKEYRCFTIINNENKVIKYPAHPKSVKHIKNIYDNYLYLTSKGIKQIDQFYENNRLSSGIVPYKRADLAFDEALVTNNLKPIYFLIDKLKENLLKSSDFETEKNILVDLGYLNKDEYKGAILKYGFIDMTFYNAFVINNELVFFDQEWKIENIPLNFILYYAIKIAYNRAKTAHAIDIKDLLHYAGVAEYFDEFDKLESYIWLLVLYRTGDVYGKDGYCNQYNDNLTLEHRFEQFRYKFEQELLNKQGNIDQLIESEHQLEREIQRLEREILQLEKDILEIKASRSWKAVQLLRRISAFLIPKNSIRRKSLKLIWKLIRPIFQKKVKIYLKKRKHFPALHFPQEKEPVVSIIIPVYNQFEYTYNCLNSILKNSANVKYEILIADDNSTDKTIKIQRLVKNVKIIRNNENLRFLKNCNNAAKFARGRYLLFLNNDTQVQSNWLSPLVELMEKDETIGLAGSKLIYPDGTLQEAGGIVWRDGSACNFGNGADPELPEFNYLKDVDYISGASIIVRRTIWEKLGGFDEYYTPAYCEDTDLAFSVRKAGYRVAYQPASVVVHFEGKSNGTNLLEGQKKYQVINQKKFYDKWKDILENEHFSNSENIFLARDRSGNKKTLLMVDHYVPHFDKDAGSRAVFHFLKFFTNYGYNVKFIGDNYYKHEPYTTIMAQMGIEVLYGDYYEQNWKTWLKANGKYVDYVVLSRPHISVKYIDEVRRYSKAKIFYYGHDLHFLRIQREYALSKDEEKLQLSEKLKETELSLMKKSDVVYYFSTVEANILKEIDPSINCKVIPINIFPKRELQVYNSARKDMIFVGGLGHTPNVDGIIWFTDKIMPLIRNAIPGIVLYIIGSNTPDEVKKIKRNDIKILGYLDDDTLVEYYKKCRVCVAPLRYGAGVKGKVLEAMYNQIPLITTTIGAEGLPDIEDCIIIEDSPELFAEKLVNIYKDDNLLKDLAEKSYHYIMEHFTVDSVKKIISEDFDIDINVNKSL
jgi:GT2 family glycosyltransferase/SAM-dependent methyltransferase